MKTPKCKKCKAELKWFEQDLQGYWVCPKCNDKVKSNGNSQYCSVCLKPFPYSNLVWNGWAWVCSECNKTIKETETEGFV